MPEPTRATDHFPTPATLVDAQQRGLSAVALGLVGSEILKIAGEIRAQAAAGKNICNLTVGDFSSTEFRIPQFLESGIGEALTRGETNYPPSDGILALREEIVRFYQRELGLDYPVDSVLIAGGARPIIYAIYRAIVDPGETVIFPTPSWNNNHYTYLTGGRACEIPVGAETNFFPTAALLEPHVGSARLICVNTPLNPTGTVMEKKEVEAIGQLVVDENRRRSRSGQRSLYLMWDQVYWMLTFGEARHYAPPQLVPESAAWTIFVDGISKAFAATGVRVGWAVAPPYVTARMRDILGHVGAWAPRAEQVAVAALLARPEIITSYHAEMVRQLQRRLDLLHDGLQQMRRDGLPVESIAPQGAIYLSARFDLIGARFEERTISTNEEIRQLLLNEAGFAVVPFQAFGVRQDDGWMRLSVGAVSVEAAEAGLQRVKSLLQRVQAPAGGSPAAAPLSS
jgi:aspartate aminotransferase